MQTDAAGSDRQRGSLPPSEHEVLFSPHAIVETLMQLLWVGEFEEGGQTSNAYSPVETLQAAVYRRRFLTIFLPLHRLGELLHYRP
ncbi:MAG: hypothetical protein OXJ55_12255 [Caldilineaceae bacterium]|nr:hypothetical protein [Caldilineaceae bacterium]